jgi:hypothetical protein
MKKFTIIDIIKGTVFFIVSYLLVVLLLRMPSIIAEDAHSGSFKELLVTLFLLVSATVAVATFYSKITEKKNEKKALSALNADSLNQQKVLVFSNSLGSLPVLLFLGTVVLAIGELKNYHMYYAYLYFYTAALFPLAYAIGTHSKVSGTALIIFYGNFLNRKCIAIPLDDIDTLYMSTYTTSHMATAGGRVRIPYKSSQVHEAIRISINNNYSLIENQYNDEGKFKIFSKSKIEFDNNQSKMLIKQPPIFGFTKYLAAISKYKNIDIPFKGKKQFVHLIHYFGNMSVFLFLIVAMIGLYLFL